MGSAKIQAEILEKIHTIPPLSQSASRLMELMAIPNHSVDDITRIVQCDSALTARVLAVVNSIAFSLMEPTTSIARAITYLGDRIVLGIALDFCASSVFDKPLKGYESKRGALWDHDLRVAIASREVARLAKEKIGLDIAFTGGILHDIGKAVLSEFLKDYTKDILDGIDNGTITDYLSAEAAKLGTNHCIVGGEMARVWNLPEPLPEIIRYHHRPDEANKSSRALVYAVHLGDIIAMMAGAGTGADAMQYQLDTKYIDYIDMPPNLLPEVMLRVEKEFKRTRSSLFAKKEGAQ